MAKGLRRPGAGLIAHSDRGSQYDSFTYTNRLDELKIAPSVGSRGDAYENAMAEACVATFKNELVDGCASAPSSMPSTRSSAGSACPSEYGIEHYRLNIKRDNTPKLC